MTVGNGNGCSHFAFPLRSFDEIQLIFSVSAPRTGKKGFLHVTCDSCVKDKLVLERFTSFNLDVGHHHHQFALLLVSRHMQCFELH